MGRHSFTIYYLSKIIIKKENISIENQRIESNTRIIDVAGDCIIYTLKNDGVQDYLRMNNSLFTILQMNNLKPFRDDGRLRIKVRNNGTDVNMYLYDLAYACYSGMVKSNSFLADIQKYYDYKTFNGLTVDHADSNVHNNLDINLSLMDRLTNSRKGACVAKVKEPIYLVSACVSGKYRVEMRFTVKQEQCPKLLKEYGIDKAMSGVSYASLKFLCENAEDYCECLRCLIDNHYEWAEPLKDKYGHWAKSENECWSANIYNSMNAQRLLEAMDESEFQAFINSCYTDR